MAAPTPTIKLAVLIDADNASAAMVSYVLAEIAKYGTAFVKRAYGDWTSSYLNKWKSKLLENSIQPMQQFAYTVGKNATDSAMIIDAMDLLYTGRFDGFCIISSDSDFTRLASRIRESGLLVYGCGERKTPKPFVTACDKFIYVENLVPRTETPTVESIESAENTLARLFETGSYNTAPYSFGPTSLPNGGQSEAGPFTGPSGAGHLIVPQSQPTDTPPAKRKRTKSDTDAPLNDPQPITPQLIEWLRGAVEASSEEQDGWVRLADVGNLMLRWHPDFDSRSYGFEKFGPLIQATGKFDMDRRIVTQGRPPIVYVRVKQVGEKGKEEKEEGDSKQLEFPLPRTLFSYGT
ncbi:NYN domain-containing protein [Fusarium avenaceum]|nr:NYN domain-containing protein [Fusarium avenaceum]